MIICRKFTYINDIVQQELVCEDLLKLNLSAHRREFFCKTVFIPFSAFSAFNHCEQHNIQSQDKSCKKSGRNRLT